MADHSPRIAILAQTLKAAREKKGLTQRALAEKVGMPQSHISKIENGAVDFQASSLLELARVLELEIALVPKALLPMLRSLERTADTKLDRQAQQSVRKSMDQIETMARARDDVQPGQRIYADLLAALQDLRRLHLGVQTALRLERPLEDIRATLAKIPSEPVFKIEPPKWSELDQDIIYSNLRNRIRDLHAMRNKIVHGVEDEDSERQPAYRLTDSDDHG